MDKLLRVRLGFIFLLVVLFFGAVVFRLIQLQIVKDSNLEKLAKKQFERTRTADRYRLPILDRNGEELAVTVRAGSVFARPKLIRNKKTTARRLSQILGKSSRHWYKKINSKRSFVWILRQMDPQTAEKISKAKLRGIYVEPAKKRLYPNDELAGNILGFTNIDGKGLAGLEHSLNTELTRASTRQRVVRDGTGKPTYIEKYNEPRGVSDSKGVYLTIDRRLQYVLEDEISKTMTETGAKGVLAIVMDPYTGEILALGQRPTFNPNRSRKTDPYLFTNRIISHLYEPGSTFKVLMGVEALDYGLINLKTKLYCEKGKYKIGKTTIGESSPTHQFGDLTLEQIIRYSSNIGAAKIAEKLGSDRIRGALRKFGFFEKTGIGLPAEVASSSRQANVWTPLRIANVGFGQGIAVTPLQMAVAFGAVANGGYLVRPRILLREVGVQTKEKLEVKRVLSSRSARAMKRILVSVTEGEGGTGKTARIPGIKIGGKTGTAQKYEPGLGYKGGKYFSSFIGFLPAEQPQLLIAVMVDEPKKSYYASQVATPLFRSIARRSIQILDRSPKKPLAKRILPNNQKKVVYRAKKVELTYRNDGRFLMPNLKGFSAREVLREMGTRMPNVRYVGKGYVQKQSPPAGKVVHANTRVVLNFKP